VESVELIKAERTLRESEKKYRLLFQNMAEGFALYELIDDEKGRPVDWRVLEVNDAYTRHTGIPRERIVGRTASELFPAAIPEYLPIFEQVVATQTPNSSRPSPGGRPPSARVHFPAGGAASPAPSRTSPGANRPRRKSAGARSDSGACSAT